MLISVLRYTVGDRVRIRLRLLRNGKPARERSLELAAIDPAAVSKGSSVVADSESVK
jgi:hypothetical protein